MREPTPKPIEINLVRALEIKCNLEGEINSNQCVSYYKRHCAIDKNRINRPWSIDIFR